MKKLLLGLGALAAVVAPVATVVACGSNNSNGGNDGDGGNGGNGGDGFTDGTENHSKGGEAIKSMMESFDGESPYKHFALNSNFIGTRLVNSNKTGLAKNMTRVAWYSNGLLGSKQQTGEEGKIINATAKKDTLQEFPITKKELIATSDGFEKTWEAIQSKLDSSKQYIYQVITTKTDNLENEGEFKVKIWEAKDTSKDISDAKDVFDNDYQFEEQSIKELKGVYLFSQYHQFKIGDSHGLEHMTSKSTGDYNDRAEYDHIIDWNDLGPKVALTDDQKNILKKVTVLGKVVIDNKTKHQYALVTLKDSAGMLKTVYYETTKMTELNQTNDFKNEDFAKAWKEKMQFQPVYNMLTGLTDRIDELADMGMDGMYEEIVRISSKLNLVASTYDFSNTSEFVNAFGDYLKSKPDFNEKAMLFAVNNFNAKELDDILTVGAKAYEAIYWLERTYEEFENFIKDSETTHPEWIVKKITTSDSLHTILVNEANKAKLVIEDKKFLDDHSPAIPYVGLSDDDIIKLATNTKSSDYALAVAALSNDVTAEKTKLDGLSDEAKKSGLFVTHDHVSDKSVELLKFLDAKWKLVFGDDVDINTITHPIGGTTGSTSFISLKDAIVKSNMALKTPTAQNLVNVILAHMQKADADKLYAAIFGPLGFILSAK